MVPTEDEGEPIPLEALVEGLRAEEKETVDLSRVRSFSAAELEVLEEQLRAGQISVTMELLLRVIRSHIAESTARIGSACRELGATDAQNDLAERVRDLRDGLQAILVDLESRSSERSTRIRAIAKASLQRDDVADDAMFFETGARASDLEAYEGGGSMEDLPLPRLGEEWEDQLGVCYRVVSVDEEQDTVIVQRLSDATCFQIDEFAAHCTRRAEEGGER